MSTTATEKPAADEKPPADQKPNGTPPAVDDPDLGEKGEKALAAFKERARTAEAEAKALREKANKFDELENASKSEQQKANERAEAAERRAAESESRLLRLEVAAAKGIPAKHAGRLQGSTREELEADADEYLADLPGTTPPKPRPGNGNAATGPSGNEGVDPNAAVRGLFRR